MHADIAGDVNCAEIVFDLREHVVLCAAKGFGDFRVEAQSRLLHPVVIHRAVNGSFERFIAILIEHFAGAFPLWLAPEQVRVLPITDEQAPVAAAMVERMLNAGIRAHLDDRNETLKYRVAEGARMKVPYMCVIGRREVEADQVAVNTRGAGEGQKPAPVAVDEFIARVVAESKSRSLTVEAGAR